MGVCFFDFFFASRKVKRGSMGVQDYSFLRDLQVEFKDSEVTNKFSLCFWFYLNEASTLPSTILYQVFYFCSLKNNNPSLLFFQFFFGCYASQFCAFAALFCLTSLCLTVLRIGNEMGFGGGYSFGFPFLWRLHSFC